MEINKQAAQSWLDTIRYKIQEFTEQFDLSWPKTVEYSIALASGILAGFLFKRFGRQTILLIILIMGLLLSLSYFEVITIDWLKVKESFGFAPSGTIEAFFNDYWQWAKIHIVTVLLAIVGFLIGFKIG